MASYLKSKALGLFLSRLHQITELLEARELVIKYEKISEKLSAVKGKNIETEPFLELIGIIKEILNIVQTLNSDPSRGKREASPINRAAYVLLISFFQGFIEDLYYEKGLVVLSAKIPYKYSRKKGVATDEIEEQREREKKIEELLKKLKPQRSNPHPEVINKYFSNIGVYNIMEHEDIKWRKQSNKTIHDKLKEAIEIRNKLSHGAMDVKINGKEIEITKSSVTRLRQFLEQLAAKLDKAIYTQINQSQVIKESKGRSGKKQYNQSNH